MRLERGGYPKRGEKNLEGNWTNPLSNQADQSVEATRFAVSSSISSLSFLAFKSGLQHSLPAFITTYEKADWFWNTKTD